MCRDRYLFLLRMIHFTHELGRTDDCLGKIRDVVNMLRKSFSTTFHPYQELCIDENLMLYKGRLSFKQYIPSKRSRFGIKSYVLCDCKTGYVQDLIIYSRSSTIVESAITGIGKSGAIVLSPLKPYLGKCHTVYLANFFYSSPALFNFLHNNCTNACGTVNKRRQGMPKFEERLKKGAACFRTSNTLLAMKWIDKKEVCMITSMYTADFAAVSRYGEQSVQKPVYVISYNKSMGIIDKVDMVLSTVNSTRKSLKWYCKFFFHLIDICVWNAYCVHKYNRRDIISMAKFQLG